MVWSSGWVYRFDAMSVRGGRGARVRGVGPVAVMPAAAFAVHQLRYYLAYGSSAGAELHRTGHSYLHSVVPWIVMLVGLAAGAFLWALGRALAGQRSLPRYTASFVALWLACAACLVAIFAAQEFLEGLFATGHPAGLVGIFGFGGWWSLPAAVCIGLILAALFHGTRWVLDGVSRRWGRAWSAPTVRVGSIRRPSDVVVPRLAALAGGWSGRGPPGR
jgi:hypothetical protein